VHLAFIGSTQEAHVTGLIDHQDVFERVAFLLATVIRLLVVGIGRACQGYYSLLTGTVIAKTRQRPTSSALLLRGIAKGEPTARLARELGLSRKQLHTLRQRIQTHLNETAPTAVMVGTAFEADELYHHAREKRHPAPGPHRPAPAARQ
jgi:hypothetical protein